MPKELGPEKDLADGDGNQSPVTREEFQQLMQRLDNQSRYMARLEKQLGGKSSSGERTPQTETNGDPPGLKEQVEKLAQEQALIRQERESLNHSKMVGSLSRSLQKKGVPALLAEDAAEVALNRNKGKFVLGSDGEASFEHNGESLTLDAWSSMFLSSEKGASYLPTKNGPSRVVIPHTNNKSGRTVTITPEQLASGDFDPAAIGDIAVAE
jgi:hypothetical protein